MHWCGEAHLWSLMIADSGRSHDGDGGKNNWVWGEFRGGCLGRGYQAHDPPASMLRENSHASSSSYHVKTWMHTC